MPYSVQWHTTNRILTVKTSGVFTIDELTALNDEVIGHLRTAEQPIHFITDITEMTSVRYGAMQALRILSVLQHPRLGTNVTVGHIHPGVRRIYRMISMVSQRLQTYDVDDYTTALSLLREKDPTLPVVRTKPPTTLPVPIDEKAQLRGVG